MDFGETVSVEIILSDALVFAGDTDLRKGLTKGFYISSIQKAVERLGISTFYNIITGDFPMPANLITDLPDNCFNIREMYFWNGSCCQPSQSVVVHWKRLYNSTPNGLGGGTYTALRTDDVNNQNFDPFYQPFYNPLPESFDLYNMYYANIQNGKMMFSSNASGYGMYRIVYNGFGGEIGDLPVAPRLFREVIVDMVVCDAFRAFMAREPRIYRILWKDAHEKLYNEGDGTYIQAKKNAAAMSSWSRTDLQTYHDRGDY